MTTGIGPYVVPDAGPVVAGVLETTITVSEQNVDIGNGVFANVETYNGTIPGPTFRLSVGDTAIVRVINDLPAPKSSGIHWHGIELQNSADGTPVTQNGVLAGPFPQPSPASPTGGTYLYKFKVTRPGVYWYHPHHYHSTNRVIRGSYGMIIVTDPDEATLEGNVLPIALDTRQIVLSDITVCKAVGNNDSETYSGAPPWAGGAFPGQSGPSPEDLCEISPLNEDGTPAAGPYAAGDVPNIQKNVPGRTVEGQTVLTNGVNVGGRAGDPSAPGALDPAAVTLDVQPGQGLRFQIVNSATTRFFRLILTTAAGVKVPLVRVGGEGGLIDSAVVEGGNSVGPDNFDTKYTTGEILLPPASRADVVVAIPAGEAVGNVLTMWTQDYQRTGGGNPGNWAQTPTVPVMHLEVAGAVVNPAYTIDGGVDGLGGTELRALPAFPGPTVETLPDAANDDALLNPANFAPVKLGMSAGIQLTAGGFAGINGIQGEFPGSPYTNKPHIASSRYARDGETLRLTISNTTGAHHPFHLHGFSFQPVSLTRAGFPTYNWPYREFRDNVDVPAQYTLTFRVRIDDRVLDDGVTLGGALGRWLFHCHIFFHAHTGMISELVITDSDGTGSEKPNVDVGGSWAYTPLGGIATRNGTFSHPDGDVVNLSTSLGVVTDTGGGAWSWTLDTSINNDPASIQYVYITATDASGRKDQTVFRLKIGAPDDGSDSGDPHIHTVDGKRYDFQSVGEFILLRDRDGLEVQARQTPVPSANPFTDSHTGLTSCVSLNTAVAARVGSHRIAYQPGEEPDQLQFYLNGKPSRLTKEGIDLDGHRVSLTELSGGATALRVDYAHNAVLTITPRFWNSHNISYMNVNVSHTQADEGLMGPFSVNGWLPKLSNGASVGPMPESMHERYVTLYQTFADSWRVNDNSSLFVYALGTSTETFTDKDWPTEKPPCKLKPQFEIPGAPVPASIEVDKAKLICQGVTLAGMHEDCVFDVATLGDEDFAQGYLIAQDLKLNGTTVQIVSDKERTAHCESLTITAIVSPMSSDRPMPTGSVTFYIDGVVSGSTINLDSKGRAILKTDCLEKGSHKIRATYNSEDGKSSYHSSSSPNLLHTVEKEPGSKDDGCRPSSWIILVIIILILIGYFIFF